ncbi:MAG: hypothetical protein IH845_01365 [Nanoarchaeota archaeon]|nr:hypothetical protein [Nanoarchaeota archaeon]
MENIQKRYASFSLAFVVLLFGIYFFIINDSDDSSSLETGIFDEGNIEETANEITQEEVVQEVLGVADTPGTKIIVVTGENFKFVVNGVDNPDIIVNEGDTVRIEFRNSGGLHDWVLGEFGARSKRIGSGEQTFVEFVASKKGTFEYYCSVGSHRALGMKGKFIVE